VTAFVRVVELVRAFGPGRPAVSVRELSVERGEVMTLVGPSGCGKSTTLRLLAGLERPDRGSVHIDGRDVANVSPQDRDVAMVFQGFALYPHMPVRDILAFPLRMRGEKRAAREARVAEVGELLGLSRLMDRRPGQLSGGERQRVAMGRALVRRPKLFLFDEPLSNLDAALRAELRMELAELLRRLGTTALFVTHDQAEAMTLGHRIAVMRGGELLQVGTPREVYEAPASVFVGTFLGQPPMTVLRGHLEGGVARVVAEPNEAARDAAPREPVLVGVRPEHVALREAQGDELSLEGQVALREPLGSETHVRVRARDAEGERLLAVRLPGWEGPREGERVRLAVPQARLCLFDPETELRRDP
jgi:multiple sugar transport system ATP-binding protein